ncbi:cysteine protease [Mucor velutinosus]|uniref:Cysteine protease n=1 Tax=Mucor velutinosus TaxID=708070 RepID=A0AAN7DE50_9FUNG|nr:cysteine protease [Mucor velutinosus]
MVKIAVFGGSKGCSRAMVCQGLEKGEHQFKLLIRNPDNADYTEDQKSKLTIVKGDALDAEAVKQTLQGTGVIVYSIGSAFDFKKMDMVNPGLCHDTMSVLLKVLQDLPEDERPKRLVVVSTTGLDKMKEVPYLLQPLYHLVLHAPHQDKKEMEKLVVDENKSVPDWIIVRPSLLTDGALKGKYRADVGISGYTISREDVGHFLLNQCIVPTIWIQKKVVVTY